MRQLLRRRSRRWPRERAFTEHDLKRLLDQNIRPLYEELGRLNVSFPENQSAGRRVTVLVDEGPVYKLGHVKVTGSGCPAATDGTGEIANWRKIHG